VGQDRPSRPLRPVQDREMTSTTSSNPPQFHLCVLYRWKPHIGAERRAYQIAKIRWLLTQSVPGLADIRFGPRACAHPAQAERWHDAAVMIFATHQDYIAFGTSSAHDVVAGELVADLEDLQFLGFTG
jgi:hypothetical protein